MIIQCGLPVAQYLRRHFPSIWVSGQTSSVLLLCYVAVIFVNKHHLIWYTFTQDDFDTSESDTITCLQLQKHKGKEKGLKTSKRIHRTRLWAIRRDKLITPTDRLVVELDRRYHSYKDTQQTVSNNVPSISIQDLRTWLISR